MPLDANHGTGVWKSIAVPSRLYFTASDKALAGQRVALKDCVDLAGIQTTMMSRSYTEIYGPVDDSADYAQKLIQLGAIIVGKSKMTAFASSDEPTDQWIGFHCPTNPRGDRYQSPSGSSAGAAAALAGYSWLDHSIGADSGSSFMIRLIFQAYAALAAGSIRAPATCNGLFSLRSSFGSTSMKGIMANCE
jgi:Asp-tRNA(Asn)/Glu-tRNA(Gln) amidotransferase A subunit family amidase